MRIALIQQHASPDLEDNRSRGLAAVDQAAEQGANIICFSELAFDPFYPQWKATEALRGTAEPIPGDTTTAFSLKAKQHGVVIVLNLYEQTENGNYDSSPVIDADGSLIGVTRMVHITDYEGFFEQGYYSKGDTGAPVYQTRHGKIGVAICYDRHYPEYMRALAINGADVVFVQQAGALGEWPEGLFEAEMRVAAFQNGYFTALCNRVGKEELLEFAGESFVCDPAGEVIARAGTGTDEILYADIDVAQNMRSHARKLFFRDRRPELYADFVAR